jgi:uncharacterized iron-regulated protein
MVEIQKGKRSMEGLKREFLTTDLSKRKGDSSKKSQRSLDKPKSLDMAKNAAKQAEVTEAKPSRDKDQQSDIGSSSYANNNAEIPENFKHIGGHTELAKVKVILLGEYHISQHNKDIVDFIDAHAEDGDIVLVEGWQAGKEMSQYMYAQLKALRVGDLTVDEKARAEKENRQKEAFWEWTVQGVVKPFKKDVKIYGWDDLEANDETLSVVKKMEELAIKFLIPENVKLWKGKQLDQELDELSATREERMLETINQMRNEFPDKKVFVIAGKSHFTESEIITPHILEKQPYIALTPKYEISQKEAEDFKRRQKNIW